MAEPYDTKHRCKLTSAAPVSFETAGDLGELRQPHLMQVRRMSSNGCLKGYLIIVLCRVALGLPPDRLAGESTVTRHTNGMLM